MVLICNCGGVTRERTIIKNKILVGQYERCRACGRVEWIKKPDPELAIDKEIRQGGGDAKIAEN